MIILSASFGGKEQIINKSNYRDIPKTGTYSPYTLVLNDSFCLTFVLKHNPQFPFHFKVVKDAMYDSTYSISCNTYRVLASLSRSSKLFLEVHRQKHRLK